MSRTLSVGLNLFYLIDSSGGAGTYARELIPELIAAEPGIRIIAFTSSEVPDDVVGAQWAGEVEWVRYPLTVSHGPPWNMFLTMGAQWGLVAAGTARRRLDVVHGLANIVPIVQPRAATVVTLLDLIWLRFPHTMQRRATVGMRLAAIPSARAADRVIAISEAARGDIVERIRLDPAKIDVTPLGVRLGEHLRPAPAAELRRELGLGDGPVVLCVAQKRVHKNLATLVRAVAEMEERTVLVLPGSPTPHEQELRDLAAALGIADRVRFPAWISAEQLEALYALASCFVLPSLEEGFGLPLLEAMRRGVPVACSNVSSMPEVAGDAALLFDPLDHGQIAAAITRILREPGVADGLRRRGHERCRAFTWQATARATLESYRRAIDDRRRRVRPRGLPARVARSRDASRR